VSEDTVTISVGRFEELRKIEESQDKIWLSGGGGRTIMTLWGMMSAGPDSSTTQYIGKDDAIKAVVKRTQELEAELEKVQSERSELKSKLQKFDAAFQKFKGKAASFFDAIEPKPEAQP